MVGAPVVRAADQQSREPFLLTSESPQYLDENLPSVAPGAPAALNAGRAPLMALLSAAGAGQTLDMLRINIYGYGEGSYTYNFDNPAQGLNLGREFDINDNRLQMNQLDLKFERKADPHQFDIGFMVEMNYGTDARFIHSSDFLGDSASTGNGSSTNPINNGPEYQFDIPQLYVDITAPWGNGLRFRIGKFLFFKQIDPNASVFFSHSFTFGAALPFTLTGITAYYPISDDLSVEGGFARGWGQTFTDNNGAIDAMSRVKYRIDKQTDFSLALILGPEQNHDNSHYRTVLDGTLSYAASDHLTFLFDGVYGYEAQPSGIGSDEWYGLSAYAVYKLCSYANLNVRGEIYRDEEGYTTGFSQTLYEATLGLTITPFPDSTIGSNLKVRPEIRYDYSTRDYFNGLTDHGQCTVALDAYFDF
jgi:hypothetical protein